MELSGETSGETNKPADNGLNSVENQVINGLRYLKEQQKLSWSEIGNLLGYSKTRVIELRHGKKMPKDAWMQSKILDKLNKIMGDFAKSIN